MTTFCSGDARIVDNDDSAVILGVFADLALTGHLAQANEATGALISRMIAAKEIDGKSGGVCRLIEPPGLSASQLLVVGLGERTAMGARTARQAIGTATHLLAGTQARSATVYMDESWDSDAVISGLVGGYLGCRGQDQFRSEKKLVELDRLCWHAAGEDVLRVATIYSECMQLTRKLINDPPSQMHPEAFAAVASEQADDAGLECEIWDAARLEEEQCHALLAVARGSARKPRLLIMRHQGNPDADDVLALVGKGVTFDSGGLSLKPTEGMKTMKCDMGGAATVLGALQAIARLNLPINVTGYCGLVENMVSGNSYKLGDVLTARNGTTIEVLNTDAEGRLVLADALAVAVAQGATRLVDLATLTGACLVALGMDTAGVMTNDQPLCDQLLESADECGERVWQLPMFAEFGQQIESEVADIKNVGDGRWGGAITAAKFLERFVDQRPWVHVDIAGPSFAEKPKAWRDAGGTGALVPTVVRLAQKLGG